MSRRTEVYRRVASRVANQPQGSTIFLSEDTLTKAVTLPDEGPVKGEPIRFLNVTIPFGRLDEIAGDYAAKIKIPPHQRVGVYMRQHGVSQVYDLEFYFISR